MKWALPKSGGQLKQKAKLALALLVIFTTVATGLLTHHPKAYAAADAVWLDNYQTLQYNGQNFSKSGNGIYLNPANGNPTYPNCTGGKIEFNSDPTTATQAKFTAIIQEVQTKTCVFSTASQTITVNPQANNSSGGGGSSSGGNSSGPDVGCGPWQGVVFNPLNWFACPVAEAMGTAANVLDDKINSWLCVSQHDIFGSGETCGKNTSNDAKTSAAYHSAWNVMRILAIGFILIAGLIMILAQSAGMELFDAYTVRKVLPRLLIAAIAIALSWPLLSFVVGLSNDLGVGVRALIYAPFIHAGFNMDINLGFLGGTAAGAGIIGGFIALGALGMLSFIATALLAIFIAFIVIVIRNILVIMLIILAPIAIAAYTLPNTQKIYQAWWDWFFKALMVFPIITAFIAVGHVMAAVASTEGGVANSILGFVAYFAPYFLLPFAFRLAGGALGTLGGMVNDRSRGGFDRLKNYRKNQTQKNWQNIKEGKRFAGGNEGNIRGTLNRGLQYGTLLPASRFNPKRAKSRLAVAKSDRVFDNAMEGLEKGPAMRAIAPDDSKLDAGLASRGDEKALRKHFQNVYAKEVKEGRLTQKQADMNVERDTAAVSAAIREQGWDNFQVAATIAKAGTKTGYAATYDDQGNMIAGGNTQLYNAIKTAAGGNEVLAGRMLGAAKGMAGRAQRSDLQASFGKSLGELQNVMRGGSVDEGKLLLDVLDSHDAVSLGRSDSRAVQAVAYEAQHRIQELHNRTLPGSAEPPLTEPEKEELGRLTGVLESLRSSSQYMAPQRIQTINKAVQGTEAARQDVHVMYENHPETSHPTEGGDVANPVARGYREQASRMVIMDNVPRTRELSAEEQRVANRSMQERTMREELDRIRESQERERGDH